jgi:hypothetical protein
MLEIVQITKKYGVTGVLVAWLWITNNRVEALENKLVNCYQMQIMKSSKLSENFVTNQMSWAILPKETKIKKV